MTIISTLSKPHKTTRWIRATWAQSDRWKKIAKQLFQLGVYSVATKISIRWRREWNFWSTGQTKYRYARKKQQNFLIFSTNSKISPVAFQGEDSIGRTGDFYEKPQRMLCVKQTNNWTEINRRLATSGMFSAFLFLQKGFWKDEDVFFFKIHFIFSNFSHLIIFWFLP